MLILEIAAGIIIAVVVLVLLKGYLEDKWS